MPDLFELTDRVYLVTNATGTLANSAGDCLAARSTRVAQLGQA